MFKLSRSLRRTVMQLCFLNCDKHVRMRVIKGQRPRLPVVIKVVGKFFRMKPEPTRAGH